MMPCKSGGYKRRNLLSRVLASSPHYRRTLYFKSRRQRLSYLIKLFKPYAHLIDKPAKQSITSWLRNRVMLSEDEIKLFYSSLQASRLSKQSSREKESKRIS